MTDHSTSPTPTRTNHLATGLRLFAHFVAFSMLFVGTALADESSSFLCNVGIFKSSMNLLIQTLVVGFSPIAAVAILGDRVISSLPIGKKRKKKFKEWRGGVLISTATIYVGFPIAVEYARQSGFPLASCINFVPW